MTAHQVTFTGHIRAVAAGLGRAPSDEQVHELNAVLQSIAVYDPDANTVSMGDGGDVSAYIAQTATSFSAAPSATLQRSEHADLGAALKAGTTSFGDLLKRAHEADVAAEVRTWPNPWKAGPGFSRTRQAVVTNRDSALAARWKLEAGVR